MNMGMLPLGIRPVVLALALVASIATAQDQDAYLDRYDLAIGNLERAIAALPTDAIAAREEIDLAFNALLTLSRDTASGPLATALERVFERARTAIANASQDDLAVQAAVLEGGFQRLVYDAALRAASDGDVALARARLLRLADHLGVSEADREAIADPDGVPAALRFDLEAGVADVIGARVAAAREIGTGGGAYRALARAYGAFLLVQDSPRATASLNEAFVDAANALVEDDGEALVLALDAVERDVAALETAARARQGTVPSATAEGATGEPSELPALDAEAPAPDPDDDAVAAAVATEGDDGGEGVDASVDEAALAADDEDATQLTLVDVEALLLQFEEDARRERLDRLEADLAAAGLGAEARPVRAEALLDAGYERLDGALDAFAATATAVAAGAHRGDDVTSARALRAGRLLYETHLSPIVRPVAATVDLDTLALLAHLDDGAGVRVQDAVVMGGQVEAVRNALAGVPPTAVQEGARQTTMLWAGTVRTIVLLVIGILALVPLFLLNLAFGGGNRNWQLIGVALFLLLVPVLYEGIVSLGSLLVAYAGLDVLSTLAAFSMFGSAVTQTVWAAMMLLAVVFATTGLYGICAQFGLVGRKPAAPASSRSTRTTRTTRATTESIDWDDDV